MRLRYPKIPLPRHWRRFAMLAVLALGACTPAPAPSAGVAQVAERYVVSIAPLKAILQPIVGDVPIHVITPPGASPHTYEPKPSDAAQAAEALTLLQVDDSLDGWVGRLQVRQVIALLPLVPEAMRLHYGATESHQEVDGSTHVHEAGLVDPHFWSDPLVVAAIVEPLASMLATLNPARAGEYRANAAKFKRDLTTLDAEVRKILAPARGGEVAVFHHSIDYLLKRYEIGVAGAVEPSPGQSPGPRTLHELAESLKARGVKAVFIEPQLPPQPAYAVAEEAGVKVVQIDPNGGVPGRETYRELILWNAQAIRGAFE